MLSQPDLLCAESVCLRVERLELRVRRVQPRIERIEIEQSMMRLRFQAAHLLPQGAAGCCGCRCRDAGER